MPGDSLKSKMEGISLVQSRESEPRAPADTLGRLILLDLGDWMERRRIPYGATLVV